MRKIIVINTYRGNRNCTQWTGFQGSSIALGGSANLSCMPYIPWGRYLQGTAHFLGQAAILLIKESSTSVYPSFYGHPKSINLTKNKKQIQRLKKKTFKTMNVLSNCNLQIINFVFMNDWIKLMIEFLTENYLKKKKKSQLSFPIDIEGSKKRSKLYLIF